MTLHSGTNQEWYFIGTCLVLHTNIHITLDTYADVFDKMHNSAVDKLDAFLDNI